MEAGLLEIHRFLPPASLEGFDIEEIGLDEFPPLRCEGAVHPGARGASSPGRSPRFSRSSRAASVALIKSTRSPPYVRR